jgi:hypothetical protein
MDPRSLISTLEGIRGAIAQEKSSLELELEKIDRHSAD